MAHAQGIGVGKRQADGPARGPVVLDDAVQLAADVLAGGRMLGKIRETTAVFEILIEHRSINSGDNRALEPGIEPFGLRVQTVLRLDGASSGDRCDSRGKQCLLSRILHRRRFLDSSAQQTNRSADRLH